jgi:hypothetical protein
MGKFWANTNLPKRMMCQTCNEEESITHILTKCRNPTREIPWRKAKELWPHEASTWPPINLGTMLSCGLLTIYKTDPSQTEDKKLNARAMRLL